MTDTERVDVIDLDRPTDNRRRSFGIYIAVAATWLVTTLVTVMIAILVANPSLSSSHLCADNSSRMFASLVVHHAVAVKASRLPMFSISTRDSREGIMVITPEQMRVELCNLIKLGPVVVDITDLGSYDIPQLAVVMFYGERSYCTDDLAVVCPPSKAEELVTVELDRLKIKIEKQTSSE